MATEQMTSPEYEAAILDLDGTVYRGGKLLDGAAQSVDRFRKLGTEVLFLTNKAIARRSDYSEKLTKLGIAADVDDVVNSGWVTARYAAKTYPDRTAFVIGETPLVEELRSAGVETTTTTPGDLLVVSMDREFTYEKLDLALRTLEEEVPFLATNPDRTCPTENGAIPDAAGMIGAVERVTDRTVDVMLGKPSETMLETALSEVGSDPAHCLVIGDRLETDILMGERAGMTTALVLSGVTDRKTLEEADVSPDYVLDSLADINTVFSGK
ncbi:phosphatase of the HAD superfamily [Halalkaliarchaeum desulfuricum]|uniref:Phosphatase of the HAD superfamily n=2 Tax=Halalkaliarchaeum desulfuricum TaxID=2055893 RepID=A0A343TGP4_9EURY|nr:phosphatase of the HAD superfamily [Halalkaliarchaeum desulfuricum]